MSRILVEGFRNLASWNISQGRQLSISSPFVISNSDTDFGGQYYLTINDNSYSSVISRAIKSSSEIYIGFWLKTIYGLSSNDSLITLKSGATPLAVLYAEGNSFQQGIHFGYISSGSIVNLIGFYEANYAYAEALVHIQFYYKPHYTNGACAIKINDHLVDSASGIKTCDYSDARSVDLIELGYNSLPEHKIAGLIADDASWPGTTYVMSHIPSTPGNYTQFTPIPSSEFNYGIMDNLDFSRLSGTTRPLEDENMTETSAASAIDTFGHDDISCHVSTILSVSNDFACERRGNISLRTMQSVIRINGEDHFSDDIDARSNPPGQHILETNPETGERFTEQEVNDLETGYKVKE